MERETVRRKHALAVGEKLPQRGIGHWFSMFSQRVSFHAGSPWAFILAIAIIVVWLVTGPLFGFSDTWQLAVNTGTTIVTFVMVFLIQNTQNRDARAIHLKLDELLRAVPKARKEFMEAEEEDLDEIEREKKIIDRADPAPPEDRKDSHSRTVDSMSGNGKTKARGDHRGRDRT